MVLSNADRCLFLELYSKNSDQNGIASITQCVRKFNTKTGILVTRSAARNLISQWKKNFTANQDHLRSRRGTPGRPKTTRVARVLNEVQISVQLDPKMSLTRRSLELFIPKTSLQRILKKDLDLKPYRIRVCHALNEDDPGQRLYFTDKVIEKLNLDPMWLHTIVFSDEAKFCCNGTVTPANWRCVLIFSNIINEFEIYF
jgi:hypothetical protein